MAKMCLLALMTCSWRRSGLLRVLWFSTSLASPPRRTSQRLTAHWGLLRRQSVPSPLELRGEVEDAHRSRPKSEALSRLLLHPRRRGHRPMHPCRLRPQQELQPPHQLLLRLRPPRLLLFRQRGSLGEAGSATPTNHPPLATPTKKMMTIGINVDGMWKTFLLPEHERESQKRNW